MFEEELETASPFTEEHAERVALIRTNVCGILDNVFGLVR